MPLIMPQDSYRFRVLFPEAPETKLLFILQSVEDVTIDLLNKRVNLTIRQTVERELLEAVNYVIERNVHPEIEFLDPNDDVNFAAAFIGMKLISHKMKASYADSKYLKHMFEWSFETLRVMKRSNLSAPAEIKEPNPFFPTPAVAVAEYQKKQNDTPKPSV